MEITAAAAKKTMGRRKIEIKKIEKKTSLQVTFAKRRRGLFRKASELSVLCGAEVAILVQSPADKIYTFSHPTVDSVINRITLSPAPAEAEGARGWQDFRRCEDGRREYEKAVNDLETEKMRERGTEMGGLGFWWEEPYEGLELHELEEFLNALENFGERVEETVRVKMAESAAAAAMGMDDQGCSGSLSTSNEFALVMKGDDDDLYLSDIINMGN